MSRLSLIGVSLPARTEGQPTTHPVRGRLTESLSRKEPMERRTVMVISVPWEDETEDHPSGWGWDVLLDRNEEVHVLDFYDRTPTEPAA